MSTMNPSKCKRSVVQQKSKCRWESWGISFSGPAYRILAGWQWFTHMAWNCKHEYRFRQPYKFYIQQVLSLSLIGFYRKEQRDELPHARKN